MKIGVNAGHTITGPGSGAVGILVEGNCNRDVAAYLIPILQRAGHTVINCTVDKANTQSAYLNETVRIANDNNVDFFVSIHFNASANHNASGTGVYTYGARQYEEAVNCYRNINALGFRVWGGGSGIHDGSNLAVLRKTKMRGMLVETCFVDSAIDAEKYTEVGPEAIAYAIAKAIVGEVHVDKPDEVIGWIKDNTGWWYNEGNGKYPKSEWREIGGLSYYFKEDGYIATGWLNYNNNWYYMDPINGDMKTGWVLDNDKWYYLTPISGVMIKDQVFLVNGEPYVFDESGAVVYSDDLHFFTDERGVIHIYKPSESEEDPNGENNQE